MIPMEIIARIRSDFPTKFGIPRQSGLVEELRARVVFEPEYRNPDALRGLEDFSHIWLIWQFSQTVREGWSPTVRPPRLGGNTRMGVFATRSPFRPNPVGLSCVRLLGIERDPELGHVTSSPTCPTPTAIPRPAAASPATPAEGRWRWTSRRSCWSGCRRTSGGPSQGCWPGIPGPPTSTIRRGCTAWTSPG